MNLQLRFPLASDPNENYLSESSPPSFSRMMARATY
jgi:hypothetical protein